jgi:hypothetical protein
MSRGWQAVLDSPMEELELGVRAYNILKRHGIDTCGQVFELNLTQAATWGGDDGTRRLGSQALNQIKDAQGSLNRLRLKLLEEERMSGNEHEHRAGLSEEERTQVMHAATSALIDLLLEDPVLAREVGGDYLTKVFLAGVVAGVDAFDRVLTIGIRDFRP